MYVYYYFVHFHPLVGSFFFWTCAQHVIVQTQVNNETLYMFVWTVFVSPQKIRSQRKWSAIVWVSSQRVASSPCQHYARDQSFATKSATHAVRTFGSQLVCQEFQRNSRVRRYQKHRQEKTSRVGDNFIICSNQHNSLVFIYFCKNTNFRFCETLIKIRNRHADVVPTMAKGVIELRESHQVDQTIEHRIHYFLDRFYMSRIGIRMLINQHSNITKLFQLHFDWNDYIYYYSVAVWWTNEQHSTYRLHRSQLRRPISGARCLRKRQIPLRSVLPGLSRFGSHGAQQ